MTGDEKAQEVVEKFIAFTLNLSGQQIEWLQTIQRTVWVEHTVRDEARRLFMDAYMHRVDCSIAYRLIRGAIQQANCAVPTDLNRIMAAIYKS